MTTTLMSLHGVSRHFVRRLDLVDLVARRCVEDPAARSLGAGRIVACHHPGSGP